MPFGRSIMLLFFVLVAIAVSGAMLSWLEGPITYLTECDKTFFDFFDFTTSNILLPVGGIFIVMIYG